MWLKRVEAERYGSLTDISLGDLGPGLSVVLGPNEAGKSSLTALVRHVLYGFPDRRSRERGYFVEGSARHGRLVFADTGGEWAVERIDGKGSGDVVVRTMSGLERPALHSDLTRGVSADAYRVVFGFGLADMADVVGSSDDIIARLYAAGAGIAVSPQDVRRTLDSGADSLFKPGGSKPQINAAARQAGELEKRLRELRRDSEALAEKRDRLKELSEQAASARANAEQIEQKRDALVVAVRDLERIEERVHGTAEELVEKRTALLHARTQAEEAVVDERVLGSASTIEALVEELPVFRNRLDRISSLRQRLAGVERSISERTAAAGIDEAATAGVRADAETRTGVDGWRDRLMRLELRAEESARAATAAANAVGSFSVDTPDQVVGRRAFPAPVLAAWLLMSLGAIGIVAGAVTGVWALVVFAGLVELVGAWIALAMRASTPTAAGADGQARATERRRLEAEESRTSADARSDADTLAAARAEWGTWLSERGLSSAGTPSAAAEILVALAEIRTLHAERESVTAELASEFESADAYTARVSELAGKLGIDAPREHAGTAEVASRARGLLEEAHAQHEVVLRAGEVERLLVPRIEALEAAEGEAVSRAREIIEQHGFEGGLAEAEVFAAAVAREAAEARARFDEVDRERATLAGEVRAMETESESSELALDLSGLREEIAALAERFVVLKAASVLLDRAQRVYERERQPAVMRDAGAVLSTMTGGRYSSVAVPLGSSAIEVFDPSARAKGTDMLSTGTAEQLYLSLRIALLGTLGDVGAGLPVLMDDVFANFDPERKAGAAAAVAELARSRQVVVFTCHPETAVLLAQTEPGLVELALDRC